MKIFIDDTAWVELTNPHAPQHVQFKEVFRQLLNNGDKLFTHNIAIGKAVDTLRNEVGSPLAFKFYETVEEAYTGTHLHILWVGRKTQKEAARLMRKYSEIELTLYDFAAYIFINRRRIRNILTTRKGFQQLGLRVYPEIERKLI